MTVKMTMHDKILGYIQKHGSITPDECYEAFHSQKLATRISEMIDRGVPIEKTWIYKTLPNGQKRKSHMAYTLRREGWDGGFDKQKLYPTHHRDVDESSFLQRSRTEHNEII